MEIKEHIETAAGQLRGAEDLLDWPVSSGTPRATIAQAHALIAIAKLLYERMGAVR